MDGHSNVFSWAYLHTPLLCPHRDTRCHHTHRRLPSPNLCCLGRHTRSYHSGRSLSQIGGLRLVLGKTCFGYRQRGWMNVSLDPNRSLVKLINELIQKPMDFCMYVFVQKVCVYASVWQMRERESTTFVGAHHPLWVFAQLFALLFG